MSKLEWSGREDLNLRPPGPEDEQVKIQVLHLVSLRSKKPVFLSPLSRTPVVPKAVDGSCAALCASNPQYDGFTGSNQSHVGGQHCSTKDVSSSFQPRIFQFWVYELVHGVRKISQWV